MAEVEYIVTAIKKTEFNERQREGKIGRKQKVSGKDLGGRLAAAACKSVLICSWDF